MIYGAGFRVVRVFLCSGSQVLGTIVNAKCGHYDMGMIILSLISSA